jgi:type II secretory pathway pseudopilin PulG
MQTVEINGKKWAVGFLWHPPEGQKGLLKAARERAKEYNEEDGTEYNAIVVRTQGQPQIGLAESRQSPPPSLPSLASALAQAKEGTWVGRFQLENGVYIIGILEGTILANSDVLCSSKNAQEYLDDITQMADRGGDEDPWDEIIVADSVEESIEILDSILSQAKKVPRVKPVNIHVPVKKILLFGSLVMVVLVSYNMYSNHIEKQRLAEQQQQQQALREQAARLAAKRAAADKVEIEKPWQDTVKPSVFFLLCKEPYSQTHMISQGWQIEEWQCDGSTYTKLWTRTKEGSFVDMPGNAKLNLSRPTEATDKSRILKDSMPRGEEGLSGQEDVARMVYETARRLKLNIGMGWNKPQPAPQTPEQQRNNIEPEMLPYVTANWEIKDMPTFPKKALGAMLDNIPGITVTQIFYKDNAWTIKGELYAKH